MGKGFTPMSSLVTPGSTLLKGTMRILGRGQRVLDPQGRPVIRGHVTTRGLAATTFQPVSLTTAY